MSEDTPDGGPGPGRRTRRTRWIVLGAVAVVSLASAGAYGIHAAQEHAERTTGESAARVAEALPEGPHITFRNTASGEGYGMVSSVLLDHPGGARKIGSMACDRVDEARGLVSCLRTVRGVPTTFRTEVHTSAGEPVVDWPLAGIPSRTRVSDDGLVATTAFVTGHSYAADSFSTETTVLGPDGRDYGNLQDFAITVDGAPLTAIDRNVWGVTFAGGDRFYATVASGGHTWLAEGDLAARTMTAVAENAECPSVSPDGTRVAFKVRRESAGGMGSMIGGAGVHWDVAVLDLDSGERSLVPLERGIDDQVEWLDEDTLLYGLPRPEAGWDADVYRLDVSAEALAGTPEPELFIEHAWSPSVVTEADLTPAGTAGR